MIAKTIKIFLERTFIFYNAGYHNSVSYPNPQTPYIKEPHKLAEALLFFSYLILFLVSYFQPYDIP